jgi:hypothetical protein
VYRQNNPHEVTKSTMPSLVGEGDEVTNILGANKRQMPTSSIFFLFKIATETSFFWKDEINHSELCSSFGKLGSAQFSTKLGWSRDSTSSFSGVHFS